MQEYKADVAIIGAGLAGLVVALDLLDRQKKIIMLERAGQERLGGLARDSFGGVFIAGSPEQKRLGIKDSPEQALADWKSVAEFGAGDIWPLRWAEKYALESRSTIYDWLKEKGVRFFPFVHWVERGLFKPGNSWPRFHMVWGTGKGLIDALVARLESHPLRSNLEIFYDHTVTEFVIEQKKVSGCLGQLKKDSAIVQFSCRAGATIIACGGIGGSIEQVKKHWGQAKIPQTIVNGAYPTSDGLLHQAAEKQGAHLTHLDKMWNYAAGVHHPRPLFPGHGLSLVPPKSALWVNAEGQRIGPVPLVTAFDTKFMVDRICEEPGGYSWQILNRKIALKELAVSGSEFNDAIRDKKMFGFLLTLLRGNHALVDDLCANCQDFVLADSLPELVAKMNAIAQDQKEGIMINPETLFAEVNNFDAAIARGPKYHNDDQLRRIAQLRQYRGDRLRTCNFQQILDPSARPLIAIREFILSRKSLGGIQTDLSCRVLSKSGQALDGLYAVGEAAGFGGGGIHGTGALEGTFLGSCVLTGRACALAIA